MSHDDPIAAALLSDSAYERTRYRQFGWFDQPLTRKLTVHSYLLHLLAAVLPLLALLPDGVRVAYFDGSVADAAPRVGLAALAATSVVAVGGLGLIAVSVFLLVRGDRLDEETARVVRAVERVSSVTGLVTGGVATLAVYSIALMGFGDVETVRAWTAAGGANPYAPSGLHLPLASVAVVLLGLGVGLRVAAAYLRSRGVGEPGRAS